MDNISNEEKYIYLLLMGWTTVYSIKSSDYISNWYYKISDPARKLWALNNAYFFELGGDDFEYNISFKNYDY